MEGTPPAAGEEPEAPGRVWYFTSRSYVCMDRGTFAKHLRSRIRCLRSRNILTNETQCTAEMLPIYHSQKELSSMHATDTALLCGTA